MPELIVIMDSSDVREGKLDDIKAAMKSWTNSPRRSRNSNWRIDHDKEYNG